MEAMDRVAAAAQLHFIQNFILKFMALCQSLRPPTHAEATQKPTKGRLGGRVAVYRRLTTRQRTLKACCCKLTKWVARV